MTTKRVLTWSKGGEADVLEIDRGAVRLVSSVPSPPGSTLVGSFDVAGYKGELRVKIFGSKLQPDGTFVLNGRPVDLTTAQREVLASVTVKLGA